MAGITSCQTARRMCAVAVAVASLAAPMVAHAAPAGDITPSQALAVIESSHPELLVASTQTQEQGQTLAPVIQSASGSDTGTVVSGTLNSSEISGTLADGFSVSSPDGTFGVIPQDLGDVAEPTLVNGSALLFADAQTSTDALLRATPLGVEEFLLLRADDAPQAFSWQVTLDAGQQLEQLPDGSVAITDPMISPTPPALPTLTSVPAVPVTAQNNVDPNYSGADEDAYSDQLQPGNDPADIAAPPLTLTSTADLGQGCLVQAATQLLTAIQNPLLSAPIASGTTSSCPSTIVTQIVDDVQAVLAQSASETACTTALLSALTSLIAGTTPGAGSASCGALLTQLTSTLQAASASLGNGPADTPTAYNDASSELQYAEQQTSDTTAAVISPPTAVDANGASLPVSLSVNDNVVTLTIAHDASTAYPILVDPTISGLTDEAASAAGVVYRPTYGLSDVYAVTFTDTPDPTPNVAPNSPTGRTASDVANWETFKTKLPVRDARLGVVWDEDREACNSSDSCGDDAWLTNVEHEGLTPYLNITIDSRGVSGSMLASGSSPTKPYARPSVATYRTDFAKILDHFEALAAKNGAPPIRLWQSWNEPDNYTGGVRVTARTAADYWRVANQVLMSYCKAHSITGCTMVAGDFAHLPRGNYGSGGYLYEYAHEILRKASDLPTVAYPTVWAYHAYTDLENGWRNAADGLKPPYTYPADLKAECTTDLPTSLPYQQRRGYEFEQTDCFVNYFAGSANNGWDRGSFWHHPHIWLDEEGAALRTAPDAFTPLDARYVKTAGDPNPKVLNPNYPAELGVADATQREIDAGKEFLAFGARYKGLVTHVFYYAFGPGGNTNGFDSALEDWTDPDPTTGVGGHVVRPVFCALLGEPIALCPGQRTAGPDSLYTSGPMTGYAETPQPIYGG